MFFFISIEGHPYITRFKTYLEKLWKCIMIRIEGHPCITRFKTCNMGSDSYNYRKSIEGHPYITRFKTVSVITEARTGNEY